MRLSNVGMRATGALRSPPKTGLINRLGHLVSEVHTHVDFSPCAGIF
jgi:hypothetical protein